MTETALSGQPLQDAEDKPKLIRERDFLRLLVSTAVSSVGDQIKLIALPAMVLALTGSLSQAGFVTAMETLPFLAALRIGRAIDTRDRKKILVGSQLLSATALATVPIAHIMGFLTLPQIYCVAFLEGLGFVGFSVTRISVLPTIVPAPLLRTASAATSAAESTALLLGPAIGGLIILRLRGTTGPVLAYGIDAFSFLACAILVASIRIPPKSGPPKQRVSSWDGLRYLLREPQLRLVTAFCVGRMVLVAPGFILLYAQAKKLGINTGALGTIVSMSAVGGLLASSIAVPIASRLSVRGVSVVTNVLLSAAYVVQAIAPNYAVLLVGELLYSLSFPILNSAQLAYRMTLVPDEYAGRINAAFRSAVYCSAPVGLIAGGYLLGRIGSVRTLTAVSIGLAALAVVTAMSRLGART